jgi:hypothetical protein
MSGFVYLGILFFLVAFGPLCVERMVTALHRRRGLVEAERQVPSQRQPGRWS